MFASESELAKLVVDYFSEQHYEVYNEVQVDALRARADIVVTNDAVLGVVETKLSPSMVLAAQAMNWLGQATMVWVACPKEPSGVAMRAWRALLRHQGIGCLLVTNCYTTSVYESIAPKIFRRIGKQVRNSLCKEQKTFAQAGNAESSYYSLFRQTCRNVRIELSKHPGLSIKELIDVINHHYCSATSARSALSKWIKEGSVPGVESREVGRFRKYYLKEEDDDQKRGRSSEN